MISLVKEQRVNSTCVRATGKRLWMPIVVAGFAWGAAPALADDWHQWRDVDRLGVGRETGIIDECTRPGLRQSSYHPAKRPGGHSCLAGCLGLLPTACVTRALAVSQAHS